MSEAKFTKGPWFCACGADGYYAIYHNEEQELSGDAEANAHLIAAAPELYEALNTMLTRWSDGRGFDGTPCAKEMLHAASVLAKARGEA